MATSVPSDLRRRAAEQPDRPALTFEGTTLTRGELMRRASRAARELADRGAANGSRVAVVLPNSIDFVVVTLAAWLVGATPIPLSPRMPGPERDAVLELAAPDVIVDEPITDVETGTDATPLPDAIAKPWKILGSGGSTGRPKLIASADECVVEKVGLYGLLAQMSEEGTALVTAPLTHNGPFMALAAALVFGKHVVLMRRFDPARALELIGEHDVDWVYLVPTMMHRIWRLPEEQRNAADLSSLKTAFHLGAPIAPWLKEQWLEWLGPQRLWELYAGTEAQAVTVIGGAEWLEHRGSVGRPISGQIQVRDADGGQLPAGEVGLVWMKSDRGDTYDYIGAEARADDAGWETLGDHGYFDSDGFLYLTDRESDMILVGGANIYPAEIEGALEEHPFVASCAVIGLPDDDLGNVPYAIVQVTGPVDDDELRAHLAGQLAEYKLPRDFERVDHPLRDDTGKVRRSALRAERLKRVG